MRQAEKEGLAAPALKRLKFDEHKLGDVCAGLEQLAAMDDPIGQEQLRTELADGLVLSRISCPIGVVGVIFESRPDALIQIGGLCLKSGNAVLLKGGREALHTNEALFDIMNDASVATGLPDGWCGLLTTREDVSVMLKMDEDIDLIIPRGSNAFVRYIMENSSIPVLGHSDGVCHVYVDADCDAQMAARIVVDAKTQYPAACNAAEMLLVHSGQLAGALPAIAKALTEAGVTLRADERARAALYAAGIASEAADESDWGREYLALTMAVHTVDSIEEAIAFINKHGSHHTDCIITRDEAAAGKFFALVDSAGVYQNCSTRFADGYCRRFCGGAAQLHASETPVKGESGMIKRGLALLVLLCMALPCAGMAEQTEARRVVYLTFDDGPKKDTPELLETLSELDVPATFFLVGLSVRAFPEYAKQIVQAGYAVGSHTMAHSIGRIQKDAEFVLRDLARFEKTMREEVDETFSTDLFRFPGGSTAYQSRVKTLVRDAGYAWFDWNTMTGDAQYTFSSDQEMLDYTLRQTEGKDVIILLMHEGKARTRRILPELVAYFREAGYEFRALSTGEEDRGILSRCGAHMMLPDAAQE